MKIHVFHAESVPKGMLGHFGLILGSFWAPKIDPKWYQKRIKKRDEILTEFWSILASQMGAKMPPKSDPKRSNRGPKTDLGPRCPREAILERFWVDLGSIWGRFGVDFGRFRGLEKYVPAAAL